jgi:uncharacterized RDD family membrane protein YckC
MAGDYSRIGGVDQTTTEGRATVSELDDLASIVKDRPDTTELRPATAGPRLAAGLIDSIALVFILLFVGILAAIVQGTFGVVRIRRGAEPAIAALFWLIFAAYAASEVYLRGTPGKWLLGISITDRDGGRPRVPALLRRFVIKNAPLLLVGLLMLFLFVGDALLDVNHPRFYARVALFEQIEWAIGLSINVASGLVVIESLGIFFPKRLALHDWLSGTAVMSELELTRKRRPAPRAFEVRTAAAAAPAEADPGFVEDDDDEPELDERVELDPPADESRA